ncbi:MAG: hypothetical protein HY525_13560 [Betaproteobacteria bacterium]|nr:hypothetical protein [Betaproteobacteria bacterium]
MPKVSDPPKFDSQNYPPDDLPEITQDQLRALTEQSELSDGNIELIRREDKRANRKIGFFKALTDRPDAGTREASAGATVVIAGLDDLMKHGVKIQSARWRSGKKRGQQKQAEGMETKQRIKQCEKQLRNQSINDSLSKRIANKLNLSPDYVRRIRKKRM